MSSHVEASDRLERRAEQDAIFEASQLSERFFVCLGEATHADLAPTPEAEQAALGAAFACIRSVVTADARLDVGGLIVEGGDAVAGVATGPLAAVRTNTSVAPGPLLVLDFERGRRLGTGSITFLLNIDVTQQVVAPGPFGAILGGQFLTTRNQMTVEASVPGQWRISDFVVRDLSRLSGLDIEFPSPFRRFATDFARARPLVRAGHED